MADAMLPRTPTPPTSEDAQKADGEANVQSPVAIGTMTPPPSDRKSRFKASLKYAAAPDTPTRHSRDLSAAKASFGSGLGAASPTPEQIQQMPEDQLRDLVSELVPALGEARMELAHTRLQFQLLSMETKEQAEKAEVEHDMTKKELEILQAGSPMIQSRAIIHPDPRSSLAMAQRQLGEAIEMGRHLEVENMAMEQRLKDAKRVIRYLDGQVFDLKEHNKMLRERVRINRERLNAMRAAGSLRSAPNSPKAAPVRAVSSSINHYATPARPRKQLEPTTRNNQLITPSTGRPQDDPFGALLFAGEVLNARASLPSTPSPTRTTRQPLGHTRGTLSLSSLPVTPKASHFAPINVATPAGQIAHGFDQHGRRNSASTISDSQESRSDALAARAAGLDDESPTDEDVPGSQASRAASDLLKRSSGAKYRQTKITGKVVKNPAKRVHSEANDFGSPKKQRTSARESMGLGIGMWPSPSR